MGTPDIIMETPQGTINLDLKTVIVKGGAPIKLTVRNVFYVGFIGKIKTICTWLWYDRKKSFKDYLNSPVTYVIDYKNLESSSYHDINAEAELTQLLQNDTNKKA